MKVNIKPINSTYFKLPYIGDKNYEVNNLAYLKEVDLDCLGFTTSEEISDIYNIRSGILIVLEKHINQIDINNCEAKAIVFSKNPKYHFIKVISENHKNSFENFITDEKRQASTCIISNKSVIESHVELSNNIKIYPNATILNGTRIGNNCEINSGTVIGNNGLGDVFYEEEYHQFVHLGSVIIKDNVYIGANVTICKGMLEDTIIEVGSRISNNVNIGHNVKIGRNCYISSGVTIGGSSVIEDNCWLAVGCTINDHVVVSKNTMIGTGAVIIKDTLPDSFYLGNPARKISDRKE